MTRRGIGCEAGYDAYFGFYPPDDTVPKTVIDNVFKNLADQEKLTEIFDREVQSSNLSVIVNLLNEVQYRLIGFGAPQPTPELLGAIVQVGDRALGINDIAASAFGGVRIQYRLLIEEILKAWGQDIASAHLPRVLRGAKSALVCSIIYVERAEELGVIASNDRDLRPLVTNEALDAIGSQTLRAIRAEAKSRTLDDAAFYYSILRAWHHLAGVTAPKAWVGKAVVRSGVALARMTEGMLSYSVDTGKRVYTLGSLPAEPYYPLHTLRTACDLHGDDPTLTEDQRDRIAALKAGIDCMSNRSDPPSAEDA